MKLNTILMLGISLFAIQAHAKESQIVCKSDNGIVATVTYLGFDEKGRKFVGTLEKDGEILRTNTVLRRAVLGNAFGLYSPGRGGWSLSFDEGNGWGRDAQVNADSQSLQNELGALAVNVRCNKNVPKNWD